jgi:hypothetical protein
MAERLREQLPRGRPDVDEGYPPLRAISEASLMRGYSRIARERLQGTVEPIYDESGLLYGEPLSKGRTGLPEGDRT